MANKLRVLVAEDCQDDAELVLRMLRAGGLGPDYEVVDSPEGMQAALGRGPWDVVLCDYRMPQFDALAALKIARQKDPDQPFIVLSGTIGEEVAVEAMLAGANDYLMKGNLARLVPAIEREVRDAAERRARKRAEEALRRNEAQLSLVLDNVSDVVYAIVVEPDGALRVASVNSHLLELTGRAKDKIVGALVTDIIPLKARDLVLGKYQEAIRSGRPVQWEEEFDLPAGKREGHVTVVPVFDAGRTCTQLIGMIHDITEHKRHIKEVREINESLMAANRAKDDFLAIVSHELRTPLTAIQGWSWLLHSGKLSDPEEQRQALEIIIHNVQAQRQIVEDLIDVSALSRGQFSQVREAVELGAVLDSACEAVIPEAQSHALRLICDLQRPVGVLADAARLRQAFANLLQNAVKFTPDGGEIRVRLRRAEDQAVVVIQDSGQGISPDFLPRLFEPFRQGENPLTRMHGGLGLGLAIVKRIIEGHGGSVSAPSPGAGQGATFAVRLPATAWPAPCQAPASGPQSGRGDIQGLSILVVEDETDTRRMLEKLLKGFGARVATAADAEAAWLSLQKDVPDLLLCDLALPGEDGFHLMQRVRASGGKLGAVPAAALTAMAGESDLRRALEAGFQMHLAKPMEPLHIMEAVRTLAGRR